MLGSHLHSVHSCERSLPPFDFSNRYFLLSWINKFFECADIFFINSTCCSLEPPKICKRSLRKCSETSKPQNEMRSDAARSNQSITLEGGRTLVDWFGYFHIFPIVLSDYVSVHPASTNCNVKLVTIFRSLDSGMRFKVNDVIFTQWIRRGGTTMKQNRTWSYSPELPTTSAFRPIGAPDMQPYVGSKTLTMFPFHTAAA